MRSKTDVYSNSVTLSDRAFNMMLGFFICYGFAVNWYMVETIPVEYLKLYSIWTIIIGYFVSCLIGILITSKSENPLITFFGYNFIVLPVGIILNLFLSEHNPDIISKAMQVTTLVTFTMIVLGTLYPDFFKSLGTILFISLIAAIVVELVLVFVFNTNLTFIDWIVAVIFCGYIGYDWATAQESDKSMNAAVFCAVSLYLDIINLFIRIVEILGSSAGDIAGD